MRDDFSAKDKAKLAKRVAFRCSNPGCQRPTIAGDINIGVAAHIAAASPEGPRYNKNMTPDQRKNINNGIYLCQDCAKMIDDDVTRYTVESLHKWKIDAEEDARRQIEGINKHQSLISAMRQHTEFLNRISDDTSVGDLSKNIDDLIFFVNDLPSGAPYSKKLEELFSKRYKTFSGSYTQKHNQQQSFREIQKQKIEKVKRDNEYRDEVRKVAPQAQEICIEVVNIQKIT